MRSLALLALISLPAAAQQVPVLDLDLSVGLSMPLKDPYTDQSVPAVSLRAGLRPVRWLSLGIQGEAALGGEGVEVTFVPRLQRSGQEWSALLADLRVILTSWHEVYLGGGIGVGHVVSLQCDCVENYAVHGSGKAVEQLTLGARFDMGTFRPAVELRALHWSSLETRGGVNSPPPPLPPIQRIGVWMLLAAVSVGLSL